MDFPKVNTDLCTGCGACADACPMEAILMENGKARLIEDNCSNCRICVRYCPVGAIK